MSIVVEVVHGLSEWLRYTLGKNGAREAFFTLAGLRVFLIDDLRNGGDESNSHGVNEVRLRQGRIVCKDCTRR
jgi:hypothetical protein